MNANDRLERMFDQAAAQAKSAEGVSSFGKMVRGWAPKANEQYEAAAKKRGVEFVIDFDGIGFFEDTVI